MELPSLNGAIAALKLAMDTAKGALAARDDRLIDKVISDMNDRMIDVQSQCLALQDQQFSLSQSERDLKERLRALEKKMSDFDQYELHQTIRGGITMRSKAPVQAGKNPIDICANCAAGGVKTFLQADGKNPLYWHCHVHGRIASDTVREANVAPRRVDIVPRW
ncbi:hypothetical protein [Janthinobacterium sp. RB2R34]|uniref:hypothetical protein n=1 Tax=Janthinobacterium sp. RB2R34 TaxID=3424193 RepID=UPI003F21F69C